MFQIKTNNGVQGSEGQISVAKYLLRQAVNEQRPAINFSHGGGY